MVSTAMFAVLTVALMAGVNAKSPQKIVGGVQARPGEFPYQVSLRLNGNHFCGGAIISRRHIVTAAHCVAEPRLSIKVATGSMYSTGGQLHTPVKIKKHPKYQVGVVNSPHDIALITLAKDIIFNAYQNQIALPTSRPPAGALAYATGWGYLHAQWKQISPTLKKILLRTISNSQCDQMFGNTQYNSDTDSHQICTLNGAGFGTCQGDSGGPLQYNNQLIGLVSWGVPCAVGLPDVFTSVYDYLPWLHSVMRI